jgi:hypothetical protein
VVEIWLTEPYYREYQKRKGSVFAESEKSKLFVLTQELQKNWPRCVTDPQVPPEVGTTARLYYVKCDFIQIQATFRIAFGFQSMSGGKGQLVALTCRTKEELAKGSKDGTRAWHDHMATIGRSRWADYQRRHIRFWRIYREDGSREAA